MLTIARRATGYHVPLAVPFAKTGGYKALEDGAMVTQSMDPAVGGTCFSEESVESGYVDGQAPCVPVQSGRIESARTSAICWSVDVACYCILTHSILRRANLESA